tara:strand:- start:1182 stop:1802 length:621 start_codon:yes stop_codon:yes gene_type:complete
MSLDKLFEDVKSQYIKKVNIWQGSRFEFLRGLSLDERGKWGEEFIESLVRSTTSLDVIWDGDKNTGHEDGAVFDMIVNSLKTEIKTATQSTEGYTYQHENIYEEGKDWEGKDGTKWDKVLFLDITPTGFYVTVIDRTDFYFKGQHPILLKSATLRKTHDKAYKFDTSRAVLSRGIEAGYTIYVEMDKLGNGTSKELGEFFGKHFSD